MPRYRTVAYGMQEMEGVAYVHAPDWEQANEIARDLKAVDYEWTALEDDGPYSWNTDEVLEDA